MERIEFVGQERHPGLSRPVFRNELRNLVGSVAMCINKKSAVALRSDIAVKEQPFLQ